MEATLEHHFEAGRLFLFPAGEWVIDEARAARPAAAERVRRARRDEDPQQLVIDLSEVGALDTAGAFLLAARRAPRRRGRRAGRLARRRSGARAALLERVRTVVAGDEALMRRKRRSILEDIGATVLSVVHDGGRLLRMLGGTVREFGHVHRSGRRAFAAWRWRGRSSWPACAPCRSSV